jgi:3-(3-hydroxy-phenyl)propionate hydroxylase
MDDSHVRSGIDLAPALPKSVEVLVVGYGPVGAALANLLGQLGVAALVIDKSRGVFMAPRAIALDNEALRILQMTGVKEGAFATVAIPFVRMLSPMFGEFARFNTSGETDGHPKLVTFYQPELERVLRGLVAQYANVSVAEGVELVDLTQTADGVTANVRLENGSMQEIKADYLVGADGASSKVRKLIGQEFKGQSFLQDWLIVDACGVEKPIDHVEFICDPKRPTPHMVAPCGRERWEFMLHKREEPRSMEADAKVEELLAPWGGLSKLKIERKAVYRFHARMVKEFSQGRVHMAGDAAHITPPFVGQGLVAGLRDAANLAWKLAWVLRGRANPAILQSYNQERWHHAWSMIALARFMGAMVMPSNRLVAFVNHGTMRLLKSFPFFTELGMKPLPQFKTGLFASRRRGLALCNGALVPQVWVRGGDGRIVLSDDALGNSLALVGFGCNPSGTLSPAARARFEAAGGRFVQIAARGQHASVPGGGEVWEDLAGTLMPGRVQRGWVAVVRPDKVVMANAPEGETDALVAAALGLLGEPGA